MGRCAFFWLSCFLKSRYCFQLLIVHKPADDRRKFAGLSTFDLAAGTFWKDFLKYMVCYRMIVIKCVCLWVFQLCCSEKLSVFFCSVCQCIYSLCCCTSDVSIQCQACPSSFVCYLDLLLPGLFSLDSRFLLIIFAIFSLLL